MTEGLAERKAARDGYTSAERATKSTEKRYQIDAIFINKPQIWVLNNYILAWKILKLHFMTR